MKTTVIERKLKSIFSSRDNNMSLTFFSFTCPLILDSTPWIDCGFRELNFGFYVSGTLILFQVVSGIPDSEFQMFSDISGFQELNIL